MISVVVPNYNSGDRLAKNLPKLADLLKKSKLEFEIIVTDDASSDNSLSILRNLSNLKFVESKINTGFGSNVDRGIRASKGDIVFILNAIDALPESPDYFSIMLKHFEDKDIFSVAAAKKDSETHGCGEIYFKKGFYLHRKGHPGARRAIGSDSIASLQNDVTAWADGGAQAIRKEYYLKIGGFDPIYKFYWEDVDLGFRAWKAGYKIIFEPKAVLIHDKQEGPIAKRYSEKEIRTMNLYGQFIFTWKNSSLLYLGICILYLPYYFAVAIKNKDWAWFVAFGEALKKLPEILQKRIFQKTVTKINNDTMGLGTDTS